MITPAPVVGGDRTENKILVIPHVFSESLLVREIEIAKRLTKWFGSVYCLKWRESPFVDHESLWRGRVSRLVDALGTLAAAPHICSSPHGIRYVTLPLVNPLILRPVLGRELAYVSARYVNSKLVRNFLARANTWLVLMAKPWFYLPALGRARVFYDFVDWFDEDSLPPRRRRAMLAKMREYQRAAGVLAASQPLAEKLQAEIGVHPTVVPNGADVASLRRADHGRIAELKQRLRLVDRFVIGYIGNHGSFAGIDFLVEVVTRLRQHIRNAHLLLVGPVDCWIRALSGVSREVITVTGQVDPVDIPIYVHACNLGVLAQEETLFTRLAFQMKVVEFTACRKFVVVPPFDTWKRLSWPNVYLVDRRPDAWVRAILKASKASWQPEWDRIVEDYDWDAIAGRVATAILEQRVDGK